MERLVFQSLENEIPKILHMIWVGENERPFYFDLHVEEWKRLMPYWEIRIWTNNDITDEYFSPRALEMVKLAKKGAQKADILRYHIIEKYGGFYLDSDVTPHRSLDVLTYLNGKVLLCHDIPITWQYISIGFFAAVPHHDLFKKAIHILENESALNTEDIHMQTGPRLLGEAVYRLEDTQSILLLESGYFYHNLHLERRIGNHFYAKEW